MVVFRYGMEEADRSRKSRLESIIDGLPHLFMRGADFELLFEAWVRLTAVPERSDWVRA